MNRDTVPSNCAISCVYIANSLLHLDSITKANEYLELAVKLKPDWVWTSFPSYYYKTKALYYKKKGDYKNASFYQDSLIRLNDSLKTGKDVALFKAIALQFKEEKALLEKRQRELEVSRHRMWRNIVIVCLTIVFAIVTGFLYRNRKREKLAFEQKVQENSQKLAQLEHKATQAEEQLVQYLKAIKAKGQAHRVTYEEGIAEGRGDF